jgi:hypothetical protein
MTFPQTAMVAFRPAELTWGQWLNVKDRLSLQEKQDLTKAFMEAGVVIPKPFPLKGNGWHSVVFEAH